MLCEDCGVPLARHGEDCGYYADEPYGNPEWGRPLGWVDADGRLVDPFGSRHRNACLACDAAMRLHAAYDLRPDRGGGRCWLYGCARCATAHVYTYQRGLQRLLPADADDTEVPGTPVELTAAGDPLKSGVST